MINYHYKIGQTPIDEEEKLALIPSLTNLEELNNWEQENIIDARKWVLNNMVLSRKNIFDIKFLSNLHLRMFDQTWKWAGKLRKSNKNIGCDSQHIPIQLKILNDDAIFWLKNSTYSTDQIALVYHHRLVKIHLFPNGNGRHARLVADCIIKKYKSENRIKWEGSKSLSINDLRKQYIQALQNADVGNYQPLFKLFL